MAAAQPHQSRYVVVDRATGEEIPPPPTAPYAFGGPHINVGIRRGRELASARSGLTDRQFRVLAWYWFATEESQGPVMMTGAEIAKELKMSPDALRRAVKTLHAARLLLECGEIGRTTFYRAHPLIAFIGTGFAHREAVANWNPPELRPGTSKPRKRATKSEAAASADTGEQDPTTKEGA